MLGMQGLTCAWQLFLDLSSQAGLCILFHLGGELLLQSVALCGRCANAHLPSLFPRYRICKLLWLARSRSDASPLPANQEARLMWQNSHAMHPKCEPQMAGGRLHSLHR